MDEQQFALRHLAFFEAIASREEDSDEWRAATAGLVTLRLVDAWLESGDANAADDEWNFRSVCGAVDRVSERSQMRTLLNSVLMAVRLGKPSVRAVVPSLMAYGQALEWDAQWSMAADVYHTLLSHLHPTEDSEACVAAQLRLATTLRNVGKMDEALSAYRSTFGIGVAADDLDAMLRGRMGEAEIAMLRGSLPTAAAQFETLIAEASAAGLRDVHARALMGRAGVATSSEQYELAIRLGYKALELQESQTEKDRILSNIAAAFLSLGVFSAARDAYLVLSVTGREQYVRWAATLNLLELASASHSEVHFEQHRRQIEGVQLPPQLQTTRELTLGTGFRRFGQIEAARVHLTRALELAEKYGYNQYLIVAEQELESLDAPTPPQRAPMEAPPAIADVALAIRELRELSEVT